ncbi:hypothetical protein GCM10010272_48290 [Streptomyces lateritius]|nr:hypothetical protein GCM10010272_48290 [Streptomyces lateritius]
MRTNEGPLTPPRETKGGRSPPQNSISSSPHEAAPDSSHNGNSSSEPNGIVRPDPVQETGGSPRRRSCPPGGS